MGLEDMQHIQIKSTADLESIGKQYVPIEPKSGFSFPNFPNPYRAILKRILKGDSTSLEKNIFFYCLPGSCIYTMHRRDNLKREIAIERGEEFKSDKELEKIENRALLGLEINKFGIVGMGVMGVVVIYKFFN